MSIRQIFVQTAVAAGFAMVLPIDLRQRADAIRSEECLTMADAGASSAVGREALERCSRLDPTDVELLAELGRKYEAEGLGAMAEATYMEALAIDPGYAELRLRLGRLLLERGAAADAQRQALAALRVQPNRPALRELHDAAERRLSGAER